MKIEGKGQAVMIGVAAVVACGLSSVALKALGLQSGIVRGGALLAGGVTALTGMAIGSRRGRPNREDEHFKAVTYNLGADVRDYALRLMAYLHMTSEQKGQAELSGVDFTERPAEVEGNREERDRLEGKMASKVLAEQPDVLFLQEVDNLDRPFMKALLETGNYQVFANRKKYPNSAVLVRKASFTQVVGESISLAQSGDTIARVQAVTPAGRTVCFSSLHVPGHQFNNPSGDEFGVSNGDTFVQEAVAAYDKLQLEYDVMGGDWNCNPDSVKGASNRFDGLDVTRPGVPTNLNAGDLGNNARELDMFTHRGGVIASDVRVLGRWEEQSSDHKPVVATLTLKG